MNDGWRNEVTIEHEGILLEGIFEAIPCKKNRIPIGLTDSNIFLGSLSQGWEVVWTGSPGGSR